ncbi:MAG: Bug family tripartite tricarboxylate transporter substrate binding protein [Lautropia sp.]
MLNPLRRSLLWQTATATAAFSAAALLAAPPALAQSYPSKPVRIVIPYGAGGPADTIVRAIGRQLNTVWSQPVIVDNRPGANEIIAADLVAKSAGDGYTLLLASDGVFSLNQHLYAKIPYDPVADFVPITRLTVANLMLVVRPDFPATDVKGFIAYAKANQGKLNYASIGIGGVNHLASAWFNSINGLEMSHVPFKALPAAVQDLSAGRVDAMFAVTGGVAPLIEAGKVKGLAVSGKARQRVAPNVPTFAEVGFPDFDASYYFGVVAPKGTPPEITTRIAAELSKIVNAPEFNAQYLEPLGFAPVGDTPEQFGAFLVKDREVGARKVKISGAKLE